MCANKETPYAVSAYLQGGGIAEGFLHLPAEHGLLQNTPTVHDVFLGRKTAKAVFRSTEPSTEGSDEIIVIYDDDLQRGPRGLIDCPYLLLRRTCEDKHFVDLTMEHKDDIIEIIENLQEDQEWIVETRVRCVVRAYHVTANRWSGIIGVIIAETSNGNFIVQGLSTLIAEPQNVKTGIATLVHKCGRNQFICVYDKERHNDGTTQCPYLVFGCSRRYKVENVTEEDIMSVAEVIDRLKTQVPKGMDE